MNLTKGTILVTAMLTLCGLTAQAGVLQMRLVSGTCRLEGTKQVVAIEKVNPLERYGVIGSSHISDLAHMQIWSDMNRTVSVSRHAGDLSAASSYDIADSGTTRIRTSIYVKNLNPYTNSWYSCDMQVERVIL